MKLLYITNGITGSGGLERVLSVKASYLADHFGYEVHILTLNESGIAPFYEFSGKIAFHSIRVGGNPLKYLSSYIKGVKQMVGQIKPDVISVCDDGLKGFFLPKLLKKPCPMIYERHVSKLAEVDNDNPGLKKRLISKTTFKLMDKLGKDFDRFVILTSDNTDEWNLPNLQIISNPLSFYPDATSDLDEKIVIAVGKQAYQKGYDRLLESWQHVQARHPDWKLHVYGKFYPGAKLREKSEALGVSGTVTFFPPVKDIDQKYLQSSIYVMSSRFEGFGMVLIEAMACGVPCISYDCPCGPKDIVSHGSDGYLVKNGDIGGFADRINELIDDEGLRKKMGASARENVKRYLPENIVRQWDDLFRELVSKG